MHSILNPIVLSEILPYPIPKIKDKAGRSLLGTSLDGLGSKYGDPNPYYQDNYYDIANRTSQMCRKFTYTRSLANPRYT